MEFSNAVDTNKKGITFNIYLFNIPDKLRKIIPLEREVISLISLKCDPLYVINLGYEEEMDFLGNSINFYDFKFFELENIECEISDNKDIYIPRFINFGKNKHSYMNSKHNIHEKDSIEMLFKMQSFYLKNGRKYELDYKTITFEEKKNLEIKLRGKGFNGIDYFFHETSKNHGMFYLGEPGKKTTGNKVTTFDQNLKQIKTHHDIIKNYRIEDFHSYLYMSSLNKLDYGISIVSTDKIVIYANWNRRKRFGNNILGQNCFSVFPTQYHGGMKCLGDNNPTCPIDYIIKRHNYEKHHREETQILYNEIDKYYCANESSSLLEIKDYQNMKIDNLIINVVRKNTYRTLIKEYEKFIEGLRDFNEILLALKFAFIGCSEEDFRKAFIDKYEVNTENILNMICYGDKGKKNLINFGFGRLRYYRKVINILPNISKEFRKDKMQEAVYQIYTDYSKKGEYQIEVGKYFIDNDNHNELIKEESEKKRIEEINQYARNYLEHINLIETINNKTNVRNWIDFKIKNESIDVNNESEIGIISIDWLGSDNEKEFINKEHFKRLKEFMRFVSQAMQRANDYKYLKLTGDISSILTNDFNNETLNNFSKKLCKITNTLKCEIFLLRNKCELHRHYVYYNSSEIEDKQMIEINEKVKRKQKVLGKFFLKTHELGKDLLGNVTELSFDFMTKSKESVDNLEIFYKCINILDYEKYNAFYSGEKHKQYNKKYEKDEIDIFHKNKYFSEQIKNFKNCLIAPLLYKNKLLGSIKLTNNNINGNIFFPITEQKALLNIAEQLATKVDNYNLSERDKDINKSFSNLSDILEDVYVEDIEKNKINELLKEIEEVIKPDEMYYWTCNENDDSFSLLFPEYLNRKNIFLELSKEYSFSQEILSCDEDSIKIYPELIRKAWKQLNNIKNLEHLNVEDIEKKFNLTNILNLENSYLYEDKGNILVKPFFLTNRLFSILILKDSVNFENSNKYYFETITKLLGSVFTIEFLKNKSNGVMQNVAHQINAPLKALEIHCQNLIDDQDPSKLFSYDKITTSNKREFIINLLKYQTIYVRNLTKNYKLFLDLELNKEIFPKIELINLTSLLINISSIYQPICKDNNINIQVKNAYESTEEKGEMPLYTISDNNFLFNIFNCITENAYKYSYLYSTIQIVFNLKKDIHSRYYIEIQIQNSGYEIPKKDWRKIFNREFRSYNASQYYEQGNGIGLYLVDRFCDLFSSKCYVKQSDSKNTVFCLEIPDLSSSYKILKKVELQNYKLNFDLFDLTNSLLYKFNKYYSKYYGKNCYVILHVDKTHQDDYNINSDKGLLEILFVCMYNLVSVSLRNEIILRINDKVKNIEKEVKGSESFIIVSFPNISKDKTNEIIERYNDESNINDSIVDTIVNVCKRLMIGIEEDDKHISLHIPKNLKKINKRRKL